MNSRREAIFIITSWRDTQDFPDRLIPDVPDRAFIVDLVYTTVRHYRTLKWLVEKLIKKMPRGETEAALLVGACQIIYMPEVPDYAAVHETVDAAKLASKQTAGLVNGVLRNLLRQREALLTELSQQSIGIRLSHPDALTTRWLERFGETETLALCQWNNTPAQTFLAVPPGRPSPLRDTTPTPPCDFAPDFFPVPRNIRIEDIPGYANGDFIVQDPATIAGIKLMNVTAGLRVLDACAAPGGKTIQLAWRMGPPETDKHLLVALDLYADRLLTVHENLKRTGQTWVKVCQGNLTESPCLALQEFGLFDRILLDAPCSNSGVLRRRPDARWRWTTKRMKKMADTQAVMLENALSLLAPGGRLVYATCSLEPEENRRQITALRKKHPELACIAVEECIPTRTHTDGAFACALERQSE